MKFAFQYCFSKGPLFRPVKTALSGLLAIAFVLQTTASNKLMQGPMLGHVDQRTATIWARLAGEAEFSILYSRDSDFADATESSSVRASARDDYCVRVTLEGLEPGVRYYYKVLVEGEPAGSEQERAGYSLLTAPPPEMKARFSIAFGSNANAELDGLQAIWLQVQEARPHAFFWLGDNSAAEGMAPALQAEQYRRQRNVPFLQPLLRSVPQLATWDGPGTSEPKDLSTFERYWANSADRKNRKSPTYFKYPYAGVDFFVLDTYSRRSSAGETPSLLGSEQLQWLKEELAASHAAFKVLLSSRSWSSGLSEDNLSWSDFPEERASLFSYIRNAEVSGVALVSGGTGQAEAKTIALSLAGGYDLHELSSSPLAQVPQASQQALDGKALHIREPYSESMNFGLLRFDMGAVDPRLRFEVVNVYGQSVFPALEISASELVNGAPSLLGEADFPEYYSKWETTSNRAP